MKIDKYFLTLIISFIFGIILPVTAEDSTKKLKSTVISKSIDYVESKLNGFLKNTEIQITGAESSDPDFSIFTVQPLSQNFDQRELTFFQGSIIRKNNRDTLNTGIGYRELTSNKYWIYGINVFHDYDIDYEHSRWSLGAEIKGSAFDINMNKYWAISGAKSGKNGNTERALDGEEIEIGGQVPYIPSAKIYAKAWKWEGYGSASDTKGKTYSLELKTPINQNVTIEAGTKDFDDQVDRDFVRLTYKLNFGEKETTETHKFISDEVFNSNTIENRMLEKVRRKNSIVIQTNFSSAAGGV